MGMSTKDFEAQLADASKRFFIRECNDGYDAGWELVDRETGDACGTDIAEPEDKILVRDFQWVQSLANRLASDLAAERCARESAEHGMRYLSTLVLGRSEGTAEEIGAAWEDLRDRKWTGLDQAALEADIAEDLRKQLAEERAKREAAEDRAESAEAREAVLRDSVRATPAILRNVASMHAPCDASDEANDAADLLQRALSSDGSEVLERVRAAEKLCAIRDRQILLATDREAALTERLRDLESENAALKAEVERLRRVVKAADVALVGEREAFRADLDAARALLGEAAPLLGDSLDGAAGDLADRISAFLDGKGGGA